MKQNQSNEQQPQQADHSQQMPSQEQAKQQIQQNQKQKQPHDDTSKLERLLCSHSLEGLVYEKRQRKQAVNPFQQILLAQQNKNKKKIVKNVHPLQKQKSIEKIKDKKLSKIFKKQSKASQKSQISSSKDKINLKSLKKQEKVPNKVFINQNKLNTKRGNTKQKNQSDNVNKTEEINKGQQPRKRGRPRKIKPLYKNDQSDQEKHDQKQNILKQNEQVQKSQKQISQNQQQSDQNNSQSKNESEYQNKYILKINKKKHGKVGRPRKNAKPNPLTDIISSIQQNAKQKQKEHQNQQLIPVPQNKGKIGFQKFNAAERLSAAIKQSSSNQSHHSNENQGSQLQIVYKINRVQSVQDLQKSKILQKLDKIQNSNSDNSLNYQKRKTNKKLRIRKKPINHTYLQIQNKQDPQIQQNENGSQNNQKRRSKIRKTKDEALKKFTLIEGASQQEYNNENYQVVKRRKGADKNYQINRIFRKTQKIHLPSVSLDVNITKFSLQNFAQKFSNFDLIHCSLPIDMLIKLPAISSLITKGFIFIWAQKGQIQVGYHWLNRIGFDVIDQIMWIKTNESVSQLVTNKNSQVPQIFPNCRSTCLVGYRCSANQKTQYCTKISNNLIFSPQRPHSYQKPQQIYQIADLMMPGARKLQIGGSGKTKLGGWMTLKHVEQGISRCGACLRKATKNNKLFLRINKQCICSQCYRYQTLEQQHNNQQAQQNNQEKKIQFEQKQINTSNMYPLQIVRVKLQQNYQLRCKKCEQHSYQLITHQNIEQNPNISSMLSCKKCFTMPQVPQKITMLNIPETFYAHKKISCSGCQKNYMCKYYFQCFSCKNNHVLCSDCMLKSATFPQVSKQSVLSDFKIKQIQAQIQSIQAQQIKMVSNAIQQDIKIIQQQKENQINKYNQKKSKQKQCKQLNQIEQKQQAQVNSQKYKINNQKYNQQQYQQQSQQQQSQQKQQQQQQQYQQKQQIQLQEDKQKSQNKQKSLSIQKSRQSQQQNNNKNNDITNHEWKLKVLNQFPLQRSLCFSCKQECSIPYWGCQTCQSWYWCGRCQKNNNNNNNASNHCHYNRKHHLHFII